MNQKELKEVIHKLTFDRRNRKKFFLTFSFQEQAFILLQLSKYIQYKLVSILPDNDLIELLQELDPDKATDIIQFLPKHRQKKIIDSISDGLKSSIKILNKFDPKTAGGLMNLDYIQVDLEEKMIDIAKQFKIHEKRTGKLPVIIIVENSRVKGYMPVHILGLAKSTDKAKQYLRKIQTIKHNTPNRQVVAAFQQYPHNKLVVLGERGNAVGIIYSDDILRLLHEQESMSLYDFAGVHEEETVTDSALRKIKFRYKWLIINMATAFLAAFTVGLFESTISKYVLLAVYMPIVAGMGGNAGTQTLAVLVRGIALKQIDFKTALPTLRREVLAGIGNGIINGIIVASIVILVNHDIKIALILGSAMVINLFVAAFFGTLVPLVMQKLGKDPATSATIFITTATDVLGFMAFLGLASMILS